jgi:hypothetical protein
VKEGGADVEKGENGPFEFMQVYDKRLWVFLLPAWCEMVDQMARKEGVYERIFNNKQMSEILKFNTPTG